VAGEYIWSNVNDSAIELILGMKAIHLVDVWGNNLCDWMLDCCMKHRLSLHSSQLSPHLESSCETQQERSVDGKRERCMVVDMGSIFSSLASNVSTVEDKEEAQLLVRQRVRKAWEAGMQFFLRFTQCATCRNVRSCSGARYSVYCTQYLPTCGEYMPCLGKLVEDVVHDVGVNPLIGHSLFCKGESWQEESWQAETKIAPKMLIKSIVVDEINMDTQEGTRILEAAEGVFSTLGLYGFELDMLVVGNIR